MSFRFMCSFLLAFLVIIVFFTHLKDSAEYKYLSTQSSQTASTRSQRLVLVQKGSNFFDEVFIEKDPQNSQESSQPRPSIYCEYPRSHGFSPRRELGVLSVEVPMWAPKQEMGFSMCNLLWPLDGWCASQNATETVQLAGISMGRLARGFMEECCKSLNKQSHKLQKCGAKSFSASQGQSAKAYWPWQECWQREAEKQERNAPKQRTGNSANITVSGRRSRVCFLAFLGCLQVHADLRACTEPFCRDYSNLQQPRPGVDRAFEESLSRSEYNARRYQVAHRESRPRAWTCRHKEPTPSHKIPWESQETSSRSDGTTKSPPISMDGAFGSWYFDVGVTIERFPQAPNLAYGPGQPCTYGDHSYQPYHTTAQQSSSRWYQSTQFACTVTDRSRRFDRGCNRQRRRCLATEAPRSTEALCWLTWARDLKFQARRGDGGGRKGGCCGQASQAATLIRAICHYAKVKLGRVEEVLSNSSHEANEVIVPEFVVGVSDSWDIVSPILLPWSHSILAEPRFVSPFKAAINALCLQWEVCTDRLHDGALQLSPSPLSRSSPSSLCKLSQRPQSNSPFQKRVCFVDHIDILLGDDEVLDMNLITVPHATLLHWKTKPWSKKRIRKTNNDDNKLTESFCLEPLSTQAVLSRQLDGETPLPR